MPSVAPRVTAYQSAHGEVAPHGSTMLLQRLQGIDGTSGFKPAGRTQPGAQEKPIAFDDAHEQGLHHGGVAMAGASGAGADAVGPAAATA